MTWLRIDDQSAFHAKVVAVGNAGWGVFVRVGAWSSAHGTDGRIHEPVARLIEADPKVWDALVAAELMLKTDDGWQIRNFLRYNPSARDVEKLRKIRVISGTKAGKASAQKRSTKMQREPNQNVDESLLHVSTPVPSRPVPSQKKEKRRSPTTDDGTTQCPDPASDGVVSWLVNQSLPALDSDQGAEMLRFLVYHYEHATEGRSWRGRWATWKQNWDNHRPHAVGPAEGHSPKNEETGETYAQIHARLGKAASERMVAEQRAKLGVPVE